MFQNTENETMLTRSLAMQRSAKLNGLVDIWKQTADYIRTMGRVSK